MSKKRGKKRVRKPNLPPETFQAIRSTGPTQTTGSVPSKKDFNPDYSYVVKDLKRIGVLAGSFIVLLVVLSLILK